MSACLLQSHGETIRGKGNAVFCPCFSFLFPLVVSPLHSVRTYQIKSLVCPYLRLTAETETQFLTEHLLVSSRLHKIVSVLFEKLYLFERF